MVFFNFFFQYAIRLIIIRFHLFHRINFILSWWQLCNYQFNFNWCCTDEMLNFHLKFRKSDEVYCCQPYILLIILTRKRKRRKLLRIFHLLYINIVFNRFRDLMMRLTILSILTTFLRITMHFSTKHCISEQMKYSEHLTIQFLYVVIY